MSISTVRRTGFTLLELLVTLVIMTIAVALVAPRFTEALPGAELKAETRKVAAMLRHARSQAVVFNQEIQVRLEEDPIALSISTQVRAYRPPDTIRLELAPGRASEQADLADLADRQGGVIRFFPEGHSSGGSITLSREGGRQASISIDWLTGRVSIDG